MGCWPRRPTRSPSSPVEFCYNRIDPFFWTGCVNLAAVGILALSLLLGAAQTVVLDRHRHADAGHHAGGRRIPDTHVSHHSAPVTSMYETIVWVAMCVALLTIWVTFLPLLSSLGRVAWNLTALPGTSQARFPRTHHAPRDGIHHAERDGRLSEKLPSSGRGAGGEGELQRVTAKSGHVSPIAPHHGPLQTASEYESSGEPLPAWWPAARVLALALRLGIFLAALYILGVFQPDSWNSEYRLASFFPRADIGSTLPTASSLLVWLSSIFVTVIVTWYASASDPGGDYRRPVDDRHGPANRWSRSGREGLPLARRRLGRGGGYDGGRLGGPQCAFPKEIQALMPVLRSNFWLGIHVLTIVTSYGGALVAWVIGNATLGCYLFGQYRVAPVRCSGTAYRGHAPRRRSDSVLLDETSESEGRRPPLACNILAGLNYRVIQITVLLLAAGTILGGLWADVSWGRFWGWDPKEVGA